MSNPPDGTPTTHFHADSHRKCEEALLTDGENVLTLVTAGDALLELLRPEDSHEMFSRALGLDPSNKMVQFQMLFPVLIIKIVMAGI